MTHDDYMTSARAAYVNGLRLGCTFVELRSDFMVDATEEERRDALDRLACRAGAMGLANIEVLCMDQRNSDDARDRGVCSWAIKGYAPKTAEQWLSEALRESPPFAYDRDHA